LDQVTSCTVTFCGLHISPNAKGEEVNSYQLHRSQPFFFRIIHLVVVHHIEN
jgi:hypothetical protein